MLYQLMNKDVVVATYEEKESIDNCTYVEVERYIEYLPYGFISLDDWINAKQPSNTSELRKILH